MGAVLGRLLTVVLVLAGTAGCERRQPAVIGVAFGEDHPNVLDVVQQELRRRYGDSSPSIRVAGDTGAQVAPGAVTLATQLTHLPGLVAVVGHADSRGTLVAAPVYTEAQIPLVAPTATSRRLRTASPWVFLMAPDDSVEAEFIANFAVRSLHTRRVAVFYDNDEYGIGLRDRLRIAFAARGLKPLAEEPIAGPCDAAELGEASIVRATPAGRLPDVTVIAGRTRDAACLGRRMSERVPGLRIIGADGVEYDSTFDARFQHAKAPFYTVAAWHTGLGDSASASFTRGFQRIVRTPPHARESLVFDAIVLLATATKAVGTRPDAVRRYLADLGGGRPAYQGITGPVAFGANARHQLYMVRIGGEP